MAEYYSGYGGRPEGKRRRSLAMLLLDAVMTLLTAVVAALMLTTYFVPYINPSRVWFFPVLGLAAPAVYIATLVLALYWVIRWRLLRAGLMLAVVLAGMFDVSLFWRPEFRRVYGEPAYDRNALKIMTYNVRSLYGEKGQSSADDVTDFIVRTDPDIVCLQEFNARLAERSELAALLDEKYESVAVGRTQAPDSLYGAQLMIFSKFRAVRSGAVLSPREAVWVDLKIDDDTVRVFNNHLRSTAINAADDDFITNHRYLSDTARQVKIRSIVQRFRDNSVVRAGQVDSIARVIGATPYRKIVCGDFNDTPMSYVYRTMARGLNDAFRVCGAGYSHTFRGFFNTLRIDYVLSSEGFETLSYEVPPVEYSDHHPVVVRLRKKPMNP